MANRIENASDDFETVPKEEWVFVEVPQEDLMGNPFPTIRINGHEFKHSVPPVTAPPTYAEHVKEIIDNVQRQAVRRLRPNQDIKALRQQAGGGSNAAEAMDVNGRSVFSNQKLV